MSVSLGDIVAALGGELLGDSALRITQVAPLERATASEIGFVAHPKYRAALQTTAAGAVILPKSLAVEWSGNGIVSDDPYLYFARTVQLLNPPAALYQGVHPSAVVLSPLPADVSVGPLAFIAEDCEIGAGCVIGPGCVLERGVRVGAGTRLHPRVVVYQDCEIGARGIVHAGAVIGADGFGFARHKTGAWEKIPQIGRVRIGDDVEIGANTTIDRGALDDTVIEQGAKLDNQIQLAHNCHIGAHSALAAQVGIAGSTRLGARVMVGGQAGFAGHIEVADDVMVSGATSITKSLTEKGVYTSTIPAQPHREWMRNAIQLKYLDEMTARIKSLEEKLALLGSEQ